MTRNSGLTLIECCIIAAIVAAIAAIAIPGLLSSRRASSERNASTQLKTFASAEADFRANDRDFNGVPDFWTADVKGLYTMTPANVPGSADPSIKLIELRTAGADADATFYPAGGENAPLSRFTVQAPSAGYWYHALLTDVNLKGTREMTYKSESKGTPVMGAVHNPSKFGFVAFPDTSRAGKYLFRVNENNTIFREAIKDNPRPGTNILPQYLEWPDDATLKAYWSKPD